MSDLLACCLMVSNDCLGYCRKEQLWVDKSGERWNFCPPCKAYEDTMMIAAGRESEILL